MKKCLVLDLDNTLWGGIVGEDGIEGLALSVQAPGNSFLAFQQAILDHYDRGVILAINSRNNSEDAWNVIKNHPNMILKEHHFAASRINWEDKAKNIRELAEELNIGPIERLCALLCLRLPCLSSQRTLKTMLVFLTVFLILLQHLLLMRTQCVVTYM
jgi:FkbH-like protein